MTDQLQTEARNPDSYLSYVLLRIGRALTSTTTQSPLIMWNSDRLQQIVFRDSVCKTPPTPAPTLVELVSVDCLQQLFHVDGGAVFF